MGEKREAERDFFSYREVMAGICILVAIIQGGGDSSFVRLEHHGLGVRTVVIFSMYMAFC